MMTTLSLDDQGQRLLELLVSKLPAAKASDPRTFISYKDVHDILHLTKVRGTYGESLKVQGLVSLADWTFHTGKPGITGLIIDRSTLMPGKGYFELFGKSEGDFDWWAGEITKSKTYDWSSFLSAATPPKSPEAVDINVPDRRETTTSRIIRDTLLARHIKKMHNYECQLCGHTILLGDGSRYAEAHHIRPLGEPHNGPDVPENLVCICPNHHAELDFGARSLTLKDLRLAPGHVIDKAYIDYHNAHVCNEK